MTTTETSVKSTTPLVEITRGKKVVWTYVDGTKFGVHEFQLLDAEGKPLAGALR